MFRHEPVLLETGGGLKNIEDLAADEPLLIYNGDILTSLPLDRLLAAHAAGGCEVTLALRSSGGPLQVALDPNTGLVRDIRGELFPSNSFPRFLFTGVYVISPEFFARLPSGDIFSIIRIFLQMLSGGLPIRGVVLDEGLWMDLGDREAYLDAHHVLAARHFDPGFPLCEPLQPVHPSAHIAPGVILSPASSVGPNAEVGAQAEVLDSVLWECAKIASRARVERCIVCNHDTITGNHKAIDFA
jgi:NDP-sugar pyrophosphorylase family protein